MVGYALPRETEFPGFLELLPDPPSQESGKHQYSEILRSFLSGLDLREVTVFTILLRMMDIGQHIPADFAPQAELLRELVARLNNIRIE